LKKTAQRWKEYYASMCKNGTLLEIEEEEMPEDTKEDIQTIKKPTRKEKKLLAIQEFLKALAKQEELKQQALDIRIVNQSKYIINTKSIEAYLLRVLYASDTPLHITSIIEHMGAIGWVSQSKYHKYNLVNKALSSNNYMFAKVGAATFTLRDGFRGIKQKKQINTTKINYNTKLTTLKDIVYDVAKECQGKFGDTYPGKVYDKMRKYYGYRCAYSSVYRAMQSNRFVRNGLSYKTK
jgi:hypothetical protein